MVPRRTTVALLAVAGLLLLTNPVWLYSNAGERMYTYERSEITVENGTFTYDGVDHRRFREWNELHPVGCQWNDREGERACAFDEYLADNPPVTVSRQMTWGRITPDFVRIDGDYYRRIHRPNDSNVTHDVEPVSPETVLEEAASNVTRTSVSDRRGVPLQYYVAVSGETVTSVERLDRDELGTVYRRNGTYYTVVATDKQVNHRGPDFLRYEGPRRVLQLIGVGLLIGAAHREFGREAE